jgi:hypothetical protein
MIVLLISHENLKLQRRHRGGIAGLSNFLVYNRKSEINAKAKEEREGDEYPIHSRLRGVP